MFILDRPKTSGHMPPLPTYRTPTPVCALFELPTRRHRCWVLLPVRRPLPPLRHVSCLLPPPSSSSSVRRARPPLPFLSPHASTLELQRAPPPLYSSSAPNRSSLPRSHSTVPLVHSAIGSRQRAHRNRPICRRRLLLHPPHRQQPSPVSLRHPLLVRWVRRPPLVLVPLP
jgi:hypothetical protein